MTEPEPDEADDLLRVAVEAARAAASVLREHFVAPPREVRTKSSPRDLVSAADLAAEQAIRDLLARERPGDGVLGEEQEETPSETGLRWVVDPLDGTVNYLRRLPHWSVSVGCEDSDGSVVGVVADPLRDEWFTAARGRGAFLNGAPLSGSSVNDVSLAAVGGEFSVRQDGEAEPVHRLIARVGYLRNYGSAALDLAWAAAGRWDAVFHVRMPSPWDLAAGSVLCTEAGLSVEPVRSGAAAPCLLVAPAGLRRELLDLIARTG